MSQSRASDPESAGREAMLAALEVPRNARLAVAIGLLVTVAISVFFLGLFARWEPGEPIAYYLGLAFVVFVSTTILAATVLTLRRALALTVHPASIVRRAATGGVLGGACWLGTAVALGVVATAGGSVPLASAVVGFVFPWAPLLSLAGVWAVHTRYKRETPLRPVGVLGATLAIPGATVLAAVAARELSVLLAAPTPPGTRLPSLVLGGAFLIGVGHSLQAIAVCSARRWDRTLLLAAGPGLGLVALVVLGTTPAGLAALATGNGLAWVLVGLSLRRVPDAAVPTGPDRLESPANA